MMMNRGPQTESRYLQRGPIEDARAVYEDALAGYRRAQQGVANMVERLRDAADALDAEPLRVAPLDSHAAELGVPLHVTTGPFRRELPVEDWPDAETIVRMLGQLHGAHRRARALHAWLLPADRAAVEAP